MAKRHLALVIAISIPGLLLAQAIYPADDPIVYITKTGKSITVMIALT